MSKPKLTFFCELQPQELTALFDGRFVIDDLVSLEAALSLGILDLSEERAQVVKRLNKAGVPVVAWLLLPEEQGYWFNIDNHQEASARYIAFKAWTTQYNLEWAGVGLDIEMDINNLREVMEQKRGGEFLSTLFRRYRDKRRISQAQGVYQALVDVIHADGYPVETYHIPLISEERRAHSTVLQRTIGIVDLNADREVLMLYSSFLRPDGDSVLWSYAPDADSVGIGNTGGGVDVEGVIDIEPLNWEEFSRDLRLCVMREKPIHIFCLEGCVQQGFLSRLNTFDWDRPVNIPGKLIRIKATRTGITTVLWMLERPWVLLIAFAGLIGMGFLFKRSDKS